MEAMDGKDALVTSPSSEPCCERSTTIWFDDGNIVLRTKTKQYRLHRGVLSAHSSVFRDMFGLPQPTDQNIIIDGCPVVDVTDAAQDWDALLNVMYNFEDMIDRDDGVIPFKTLRAALVLGTKYDYERYRTVALRQLQKLFPQTLSAWDDANELRLCYLSELYELLELVLSFGRRTMLPLAYYLCTSEGSTANIVQEYRQTRDRPLPLDAIDTLILAYPNMRYVMRDVVLKWCWDGTIPSSHCLGREACSENVSDAFRHMSTNQTMIELFLRPGLGVESVDLCSECKAVAAKEDAKGRQSAWLQLPSVFGMGNWESLGE